MQLLVLFIIRQCVPFSQRPTLTHGTFLILMITRWAPFYRGIGQQKTILRFSLNSQTRSPVIYTRIRSLVIRPMVEFKEEKPQPRLLLLLANGSFTITWLLDLPIPTNYLLVDSCCFICPAAVPLRDSLCPLSCGPKWGATSYKTPGPVDHVPPFYP